MSKQNRANRQRKHRDKLRKNEKQPVFYEPDPFTGDSAGARAARRCLAVSMVLNHVVQPLAQGTVLADGSIVVGHDGYVAASSMPEVYDGLQRHVGLSEDDILDTLVQMETSGAIRHLVGDGNTMTCVRSRVQACSRVWKRAIQHDSDHLENQVPQ